MTTTDDIIKALAQRLTVEVSSDPDDTVATVFESELNFCWMEKNQRGLLLY